MASYADWVDDLILLCKSHHMGYDELKQEQFDARLVGSPSAIVNRRYLAAVLRIADILEFDPERTPENLFHHRTVSEPSAIFWWKDHSISMQIESDKQVKRLVLQAEPPNAQIHRALEVMVNQIDEELRLCSSVAAEKHFDVLPGCQQRLKHRWDLQPSAQRRITPKNNAYEYIDGAFRPDTPKLLELLSGTELYGSSLAAIRELLQNAFDAVQEQMAHDRLEADNPNDPKLLLDLGNRYSVELRLEFRDDRRWLTCTDKGVGMTKAIIRDHLLVSGRSRREDLLALQRQCKERGFALERTGQFGVGVLSYFMLADQVVIRTRRSAQAGSTEAHGWRFETEGIGSFGQLQADYDWTRGTQVCLRLRSEAKNFSLSSYLKTLLVHIPCRLRFSDDLRMDSMQELGPGWADGDLELARRLVADSPRQFGEFQDPDPATVKMLEVIRESLGVEKLEGILPSGLGRFRILLPFFNLQGGPSLGYMRVNDTLGIGKIRNGTVYLPRKREDLVGWKGMSVSGGVPGIFGDMSRGVTLVTQVDWTSNEAAQVTVSRTQISESEAARKDLEWVVQQSDGLLQQFLTSHRDSVFHSLNCRIASEQALRDLPSHWLTIEQGPHQAGIWTPVSLPAAVLVKSSLQPPLPPSGRFSWRGQPVFVMQSLVDAGDPNKEFTPIFPLAPDRLLVYGDAPQLGLAALLTERSSHQALLGMGTCTFSPSWKHVCKVTFRYGYVGEDSTLLNSDHFLIHALDPQGLRWLEENDPVASGIRVRAEIGKNFQPAKAKPMLLDSRGRAAAFLLKWLDLDLFEKWRDVEKEDPMFFRDIWDLVFGPAQAEELGPTRSVLGLMLADDVSALFEFTYAGVKIHTDSDTIFRSLPEPGPDWRLQVVPAMSPSGVKTNGRSV